MTPLDLSAIEGRLAAASSLGATWLDVANLKDHAKSDITSLIAAVRERGERIAAMEAALKPFAQYGAFWESPLSNITVECTQYGSPHHRVSLGTEDFRRARAALASGGA